MIKSVILCCLAWKDIHKLLCEENAGGRMLFLLLFEAFKNIKHAFS